MRRAALIGIFVACAASMPALAQSLPTMTTAALAIGDTLPPVGWVQFCADSPQDCDTPTLAAQPAPLDDKRWKQLLRINRDVNDAVEPVSDLEHWGMLEKWSYPTDGKGDCEDYVLEKRRLLMEAGWPRQSLLITVVRDRKGDGHAVLTVKTERGDFVLDNQDQRVRSWADTGYKFVKRQSETHPNKWVSLGGPDQSILTANRNR